MIVQPADEHAESVRYLTGQIANGKRSRNRLAPNVLKVPTIVKDMRCHKFTKEAGRSQMAGPALNYLTFSSNVSCKAKR
jgi:hypothetical protein